MNNPTSINPASSKVVSSSTNSQADKLATVTRFLELRTQLPIPQLFPAEEQEIIALDLEFSEVSARVRDYRPGLRELNRARLVKEAGFATTLAAAEAATVALETFDREASTLFEASRTITLRILQKTAAILQPALEREIDRVQTFIADIETIALDLAAVDLGCDKVVSRATQVRRRLDSTLVQVKAITSGLDTTTRTAPMEYAHWLLSDITRARILEAQVTISKGTLQAESKELAGFRRSWSGSAEIRATARVH